MRVYVTDGFGGLAVTSVSQLEGAIPMNDGMAYNLYFIDDEKTVVLDAVDKSVSGVFYENVDHMLNGRPLTM